MSAARIKAKCRVVLEAPETSPWARIRALEARIVDVELRHEKAIARLALVLGDIVDHQAIAWDKAEERVTAARVAVDNLVPVAAQDAFEEWERGHDEENVEEFERLKSLDVIANPKKRERDRKLESKQRARDRSTLKVAGTEEAGA